MTRPYVKPIPIEVQPTRIPGGQYLTLTGYAASRGMTRMTAYNLLKKRKIRGIRVGGKAFLIRV